MAACKFEVISRNPKTGAVEIDRDKCTLCKACLSACPFGNIIWEKKSGRVVKCDLCGGDPECAKTCPSGTLTFV
jgi:Fe-S-cluster-containing hydrogenase component 2